MKHIFVYSDRVIARGHEAIKALHDTTFELTKDSHLTEKGDCIIGVNADKSASELNPQLREALKKNTSVVLIILKVDNIIDTVVGQGHRNLILNDQRRIIVRRSSYIDSATIVVNANKAAKQIKRNLIEKLRKPDAELIMEIYALDLDNIVQL